MSDYIKREDALKPEIELLPDISGLKTNQYEAFLVEQVIQIYKNYLKNLPAADVVERNQWIPVTERLPEDRNMVLATVDGVVCVAFYGNYMWEEVETYSIFYPTHWMPLPSTEGLNDT